MELIKVSKTHTFKMVQNSRVFSAGVKLVEQFGQEDGESENSCAGGVAAEVFSFANKSLGKTPGFVK